MPVRDLTKQTAERGEWCVCCESHLMMASLFAALMLANLSDMEWSMGLFVFSCTNLTAVGSAILKALHASSSADCTNALDDTAGSTIVRHSYTMLRRSVMME